MANCIGTVSFAQKGQNTCVGILFFYLTAKLEYFEYMCMPLELFPIWIQEQYNFDVSVQGICAFGNATGSVGLTSCRHSCKQTPPTWTCPIWIFWACQHSWVMASQDSVYFFHIGGRWFWGKIGECGRYWSFDFVNQEDIYSYQRLDGQSLLRHSPRLGLY